jgi:hypothetical protein
LTYVVATALALPQVEISLERTGRPGVKVVPVLWGFPSDEALEMARRGEVELRGCAVPSNAARYAVHLSW